MTLSVHPYAVQISDSVERSAAELLIEIGARQLRSAHIAKRAGIPESTLFRKYKNVDEILAATYEWSWTVVNQAVIEGSYSRPLTDPRDLLLQDTRSILSMRNDDATATALYTAFLLMRRRKEFKIDEECAAQSTFETRLRSLCESVLASRGVHENRATELVATLIMNYIATVCLTWLLMPTGTDDVTAEEHDLTVEEAQFGLLVLLDKGYADGLIADGVEVEN
jgi:AcrR family transcriptional regulator